MNGFTERALTRLRASLAFRKNSAGSVFVRRRLNLIEGSNVTLTVADDPTNDEVDVTIAASGGGGGHTIQEDGTPLTARSNLNFDDGIIATDDAGNDATNVNLDYANAVASLNTDGSSVIGSSAQVSPEDHVHAIPATLDTNARVGVRKNSAGGTSLRRRLNLIEGSNITLTISDDAGDEEIDITVTAGAGGGGLTTLLNGRPFGIVQRNQVFNSTAISALGGYQSPTVVGTPTAFEDSTGAYINYATSTALNAAAGWAWGQTDVRVEVQPRWEYIMKTGANASDVANTRIWCAFVSAAALDQSDAGVGNVAGFRYSTSAGDANWQAVTRNAGTGLNTIVDTGVPITANTRYVLIIDASNPASIVFMIGVGGTQPSVVATISTTLPVVTTTGSPYATITNLSAGTARAFRLVRMIQEANG
jgi:hypothetical protein